MRFADESSPTQSEIREWAYSGEPPPVEDWDVVVADLDNVELLVELVGDPGCPHRGLLLRSLYCLVAHSDWDDPRLTSAVSAARESPDPWLRTWARRTGEVAEDPSAFAHREWCGGILADEPEG